MKRFPREVAENALIFAGILTLWPWILGHRSWYYAVLSVFVLISLAALAVRRWRRLTRAMPEVASDHLLRQGHDAGGQE